MGEREEQLQRLAGGLRALEASKRRDERRHLGIGLAVIALVFLAANEFWGPGLIVLIRDLIAPIARAIR